MGDVWQAFQDNNGWDQTWIHIKLSITALAMATVVAFSGKSIWVPCGEIASVASRHEQTASP